jgi:hypothetical protein
MSTPAEQIKSNLVAMWKSGLAGDLFQLCSSRNIFGVPKKSWEEIARLQELRDLEEIIIKNLSKDHRIGINWFVMDKAGEGSIVALSNIEAKGLAVSKKQLEIQHGKTQLKRWLNSAIVRILAQYEEIEKAA